MVLIVILPLNFPWTTQKSMDWLIQTLVCDCCCSWSSCDCCRLETCCCDSCWSRSWTCCFLLTTSAIRPIGPSLWNIAESLGSNFTPHFRNAKLMNRSVHQLFHSIHISNFPFSISSVPIQDVFLWLYLFQISCDRSHTDFFSALSGLFLYGLLGERAEGYTTSREDPVTLGQWPPIWTCQERYLQDYSLDLQDQIAVKPFLGLTSTYHL
jgi:hypothetical protein